MSDVKTAVVVLGVGTALIGGLWLLKRAAGAPGEAAGVTIELFDAEGNPVALQPSVRFPGVGVIPIGGLVEGESYFLSVGIQNRSNRVVAGEIESVAAAFDIVTQDTFSPRLFADDLKLSWQFAPLEVRAFTVSFTVPVGAANRQGLFRTYVYLTGTIEPLIGSGATPTYIIAPIVVQYQANVTIA